MTLPSFTGVAKSSWFGNAIVDFSALRQGIWKGWETAMDANRNRSNVWLLPTPETQTGRLQRQRQYRRYGNVVIDWSSRLESCPQMQGPTVGFHVIHRLDTVCLTIAEHIGRRSAERYCCD